MVPIARTQTDLMEQLSEELVLLSPLQLHGLPAEGVHIRFSLSSNNAPPIELNTGIVDCGPQWLCRRDWPRETGSVLGGTW